jgi:transcriptional regulator with XRE-family HTH domain
MNLGARLKAERERLGLSQTDFAAVAGASKHAQINWEKGAAAPNASALAAWAKHGLDVLYVVTGARSNPPAPTGLPSTEPVPIDAERLVRIVEMLEAAARLAGRKWQTKKLVALAAEVYNVLADEPALDEPKVERILKLVVNR